MQLRCHRSVAHLIRKNGLNAFERNCGAPAVSACVNSCELIALFFCVCGAARVLQFWQDGLGHSVVRVLSSKSFRPKETGKTQMRDAMEVRFRSGVGGEPCLNHRETHLATRFGYGVAKAIFPPFEICGVQQTVKD